MNKRATRSHLYKTDWNRNTSILMTIHVNINRRNAGMAKQCNTGTNWTGRQCILHELRACIVLRCASKHGDWLTLILGEVIQLCIFKIRCLKTVGNKLRALSERKKCEKLGWPTHLHACVRERSEREIQLRVYWYGIIRTISQVSFLACITVSNDFEGAWGFREHFGKLSCPLGHVPLQQLPSSRR